MWVKKFRKHKTLKKKLLSLITKMPSHFKSDKSFVKSDWTVPKDVPREYLKLFYQEVGDLMVETAEDFGCNTWKIHNGWYNQYSKNNNHHWHTHPESNLSAIYFVELPNKELMTEFKTKIKLNVKEGDILFFPSYMLHRAPVNNTNKRKTVIAFNCDFQLIPTDYLGRHK